MIVLKTRYQKLSRVCFAPDGRGLAAAGQKGAFWWRSPLDAPQPERRGDSECRGIGFTPDGAHLLTALSQGYRHGEIGAMAWADGAYHTAMVGSAWVWMIVCPATGRGVVDNRMNSEMSGWRVGSTGAPERVWRANAVRSYFDAELAFGPTGEWFVRAIPHPTAAKRAVVTVHDAATGAAGRTLDAGEWVTAPLAVSPDGALVVCPEGSQLRVLNLNEPSEPRVLENDNTRYFTGLAFHPSGRFLAATNNDSTVKLYDTSNWELARTFTWEIGKMRSIAFSPDGALAAAGSDKGQIVVWDVDV